ncbi:isoleucine--tRNA ligase, partial [bacterium]
MDLRLNLPDANATIPMKANLPALEPQIQARWDAEGIYGKIMEARRGAPTFVLHDGPPYTNSPIHIGTALNKILKDFVVKSRTLMGFSCPYVPGFDTHGLPIEQAVTKKLAEKKVEVTGSELRKACREHVAEYIGVQTEQFKRLGVFGLWERPYATLDYKFEAEVVRTFRRLVENKLVYRGLRPTQWSPTLRTALADTEIVYKDHTSKAIYVAFPLLSDPNKLFTKYNNLATIIWTTTPWTIPSNLAVAFHPDMEYAVVRVRAPRTHTVEDVVGPNDWNDHGKSEPAADYRHYLILDALVLKVAAALEWDEYEVVERLLGVNLGKATFEHPIFKRPSIAVMADYVTTEDGTGVVHTAPSHGRDDFFTGQKYGLPVPNTVDERGVLTHEAGEFEGVHYKKCDTVVVDRLDQVGALLKSYDYFHSYPYAERDDQPVIFRATEQWFVSIDPLRTKMLQEIDKVDWIPETGQNRIDAMVRNRPDWCVSRQRAWGVGIPVFYGAKSRVPVLDPAAIEAVAHAVEKGGSDAWFELSPEQILPQGYVHPETGETEFTKETDTLDVWFDSGSTSLVVLDQKVFPEWKLQGLHWPADLYLEGSDQHRGWFNTSLILGTAIKGSAPYKKVLTHGFIVDGQGRKISKRLGNGVEPIEASNQYGADILRLWVATVDYTNDAPISDAILKQCGELYRNIRNTLRFLLANAAGLPSGEKQSLLPLDEWAVEQADLLVADVVDAYERYDFGAVVHSVHNFCRETLSKFYLDAIKDRMYCEATDSALRRSGQAACREVLVRLTALVAPILAHTAEETWGKLREVAPGEDLTETVFT